MNILLIGPQGCGKGTVSEKICKDFHLTPLSTGQLFRAEIANGTELGRQAKAFMDKGLLVPLELTVKILSERLKADDCKNGVIFDGFPRNVEQAEALSKIAKVDFVVEIDVPKEVCVSRLLARRVCEDCGRNYSTLTYQKPTCEKCGGRLFKRDDDNLEQIETRLEVYEKQTTPLIDFYADRLVRVNGDQSPEKVYEQIKNFLRGRV